MERAQLDSLKADLEELGKKHGVTGISFCGYNEKSFVGFMGIGTEDSAAECFNAVLAVGRLWQASREGVRAILDDFERRLDDLR